MSHIFVSRPLLVSAMFFIVETIVFSEVATCVHVKRSLLTHCLQ